MTDHSKPFGTDASTVAKVGKSKSPLSLEARMPTREIASKVGGQSTIDGGARMHRVVRRSAAV